MLPNLSVGIWFEEIREVHSLYLYFRKGRHCHTKQPWLTRGRFSLSLQWMTHIFSTRLAKMPVFVDFEMGIYTSALRVSTAREEQSWMEVPMGGGRDARNGESVLTIGDYALRWLWRLSILARSLLSWFDEMWYAAYRWFGPCCWNLSAADAFDERISKTRR